MLRSRVFVGGQAVSMLGDGLATLAIPLLVLRLTRNPVLAVLASAPVTPAGPGAILAGAATALAGGNPRPAFAVAGGLTIATVLIARVTGVPPAEAGRSIGRMGFG